MILLIDNYDSFVYNLARYVSELGFCYQVKRNDVLTLSEVVELNPSHIILSPGPASPNEAGICLEVVKNLANRIPILGVCLGHQVIGQAFGGSIIRAQQPLFGKVDMIQHNGQAVFKGLPNPLKAARYHALIVSQQQFPKELQILARSSTQEVMALQHRQYACVGVQFHPESILTTMGHELLKNFMTASLTA